jgi:hypothetical protein
MIGRRTIARTSTLSTPSSPLIKKPKTSMTHARPKVEFAQLGLDNYSVWAVRAKAYFRACGVEDCFLHPDLGAHSAETIALYPLALDILLSLVQDRHIHVIDKPSMKPYLAWNILANFWRDQALARRTVFESQLHALKLQPGEKMILFIERSREIMLNLQATGEIVLDSHLIAHMIRALPSSYDSFVFGAYNNSDLLGDLNKFTAQLLLNEQLIKGR